MERNVSVFVVVVLILLLVGCARVPDSQQIKADLIGHTMGSMVGGWEFVSISEFQEFTINDMSRASNIIEYDIEMLLEDIDNGKRYRANALVVYRKTDGKWQIVSIHQKSFAEDV